MSEAPRTATARAPADPGPLLALLVVGATLAVFAQTAAFGTVFIDDFLYVAEPVTRGFSADGLRFCFTTFRAGNWHPLTWLSLMLDAQVWRGWLGGWHLTSALLHALNAALVFRLVRRLGGSPLRSALVAALFALHPLRAESVAWLSERKDVLSGTFFLLTLLAYLRYVAQPGLGRGLAVAGALAAGLLAKPMLVTTPFVLLLLDVGPLRRAERVGLAPLLREKVPLFLLCLGAGLATIAAQASSGAVATLRALPPGARLANASLAVPRYLWMTLWPARLGPYYGISRTPPWPAALAAAAGLLAVTALAFALRRRLPWLLTGWLWFVGMLAPTLGLFQVGAQALADRYTYLPHVGLFLGLVLSLPEIPGRVRRGLAGAAAALLVAALAVRCAGQTAAWASNTALIACAARADPDGPIGLIGRAVEAEHRGALDESLALFGRVPAAGMDLPFVHYAIGQLELRKGEPARAAAELAEAVRREPSSSDFRRSLAQALTQAGQLGAAIESLRGLLAQDAGDVAARAALGLLLGRSGDDAGAAAELQRAAAGARDDARLQLNTGVALARLGRTAEAIRYFEAALALQPGLPGAAALLEQARRDAAAH